MPDKTQKLFYVRIDFVDLMDFATDPAGEHMSLLAFAKELKKEKSEIPQIQRIINEAHCYIQQKKEAGLASARRRAEKAKREAEKQEQERLKLEAEESQRRSNGVTTPFERSSTDPQRTSTNNRSSNIKSNTIQGKQVVVGKTTGEMFQDEVEMPDGTILRFS